MPERPNTPARDFLMGRIVRSRPTLSLSRNTGRCLLATWCILINVSGVWAQGETERLPDAEGVVLAYMRAENWVNTFHTPPLDHEDSHINVDGAEGFCVILRQSGRIVGIGHDHAGDDLMLRRAVGRALGQVLGDPAVANMKEEFLDQVGRSLTLELDVAGKFVPLPGRTFGQIANRLEPGLDGLAMRRNETWAITYPAQTRAMNNARNLTGILSGFAAQLGFPGRALRDIQSRAEISVYSFRSIHLAQAKPTAFPSVIHRGDELVAIADVTPQRIAQLANGIAHHLESSLWPEILNNPQDGEFIEPPGIKGDYHPVSDDYRPIVAPFFEQALVAFSMFHYARNCDDKDRSARVSQISRAILSNLARAKGPIGNELDDPVTAAALVYALCEMPELGEDPDLVILRERSLRRIISCRQADGTFRKTLPDNTSSPLPPQAQAIMVGALSRALVRTLPDTLGEEDIRSSLDSIWRSLPPHQHVGLLPWIGWAEQDYAAVTDGKPQPEQLKNLLSLVQASRLDGFDGDSAADLKGGFSLSSARSQAAPRATAQSLRPAAWIAGILPDQNLISQEQRVDAVRGHMLTLRFIMQLSVRPKSEWRYRSPKSALGGIREALWDSNQPVAAQAMALITASATLESLHELREPAKNH